MVCVMTGATGGIGSAVAEEMAMRGAKLVVSGRNSEKLDKLRLSTGGIAVAGDVTAEGFAEKLFSIAPEGNLSAVFAAGSAHFGPTLQMSESGWKEIIETNLCGLYRCCLAAIAEMMRRGGGHVIAVLSIASVHPFPNSAAYVASKFGGLGLVKSLAAEFRDKGIQFTAFMPGSTDTELWSGEESPRKKDMLVAEDVGIAIADILFSKSKGYYDEVLYMPRKGIL
jgi:3-oxoacyl-[acyl-carrier protein] reductase